MLLVLSNQGGSHKQSKTCRADEKFIRGFGGETWRKETAWKT